jgi:hypothetical protein
MESVTTRKRNVMVLIQARDLAKIRGRVETQLKKFDGTSCEIMPGVWHLVTSGNIGQIKSKMVGAVSDWEDDRVLVLGNPDEFAAWDGHRGQHVRGKELFSRFVHTSKDSKGKLQRRQPKLLSKFAKPVWVA